MEKMIESGVPDLEHPCFEGVADKITVDGNITTHATRVAAIMVDPEYGIAKDFAHLYCKGTSSTAQMIINTEWLLDQGVNIINYSWGGPTDDGVSSIYDECALWLDHIAYNHSVHCVVASGNYSNDKLNDLGMSYNAITVGNIDDNGTVTRSDDRIEPLSSFNLTYDFDAFKPDLSAPGTQIMIPGKAIGEETYSSTSGTSFSTPHVTAIVAMLCSYNPELLTKQALMKSILLNSVSRVSVRYGTMPKTSEMVYNESVGINIHGYRVYGSGNVNAFNAKYLIDSGNYINSTISSSQTQKVYSLGTINEGQTVSVTLSFLKRAIFSTSQHGDYTEISSSRFNLNLTIYRASDTDYSNPVAYSNTRYNNVEKIIHTFEDTDEYVVVVNRVSDNISYAAYFGLSWLVDFSGMQ